MIMKWLFVQKLIKKGCCLANFFQDGSGLQAENKCSQNCCTMTGSCHRHPPRSGKVTPAVLLRRLPFVRGAKRNGLTTCGTASMIRIMPTDSERRRAVQRPISED